MAYNTNNPVGSTDPRDLYDNAGNLDKYVNGADPFYQDRLGKQRISLSGMEQDFRNAQDGRAAEFDQFLADSSFVFIGYYAAGLTITSRSQYFIRNGLAYRLAPSASIPYTITGDWDLEVSNFTPFNTDADLRQELSEPDGASKVGYKNRDLLSRVADDAHIFDYIPVSLHNSIIEGTSTDDCTSYYHQAIAELAPGSVIQHPPAGTINVSSINVDKAGIGFRGGNGGSGTISSIIKGLDPNLPVINVSAPQFNMFGMGIYGVSASGEYGSDVAQDGILWSAPGSWLNNLDGNIQSCVFAFLRDAIDMRGRNIKLSNNLFSNSRRSLSLISRGILDCRGLDMRGNRHHAIGKTGSTDSAAVWIDPAQGFTDVVIDDYGDFCVGGFRGFASNAKIELLLTKSYGSGIILDPVGVATALARRTVKVVLDYHQDNPESVAASGLIAMGGNAYQLEADFKVKNSGGHGVQISCNYNKFRGYVNNAGQSANNTFDCVYIAPGATGNIVAGVTANQDTFGGVPNKARSGFNNQGTDTEFLGGNTVTAPGNFGTAPFIQNASTFFKGINPNEPVRVTTSWGGTMPNSGSYQAGSIHWNTNPVIAGTAPNQYMIHGWRRITTGNAHVLNTDWREMRMPTGT